MRVVLDANVIVSGIITRGGLSDRILRAWRDGRFILCSSPGIVTEVSDVLGRASMARYVEEAAAGETLARIQSMAEFPYAEVEPVAAVRDRKDDMVLECALGCEADLVVTNDEDLLALKAYEGIGIVSLRDFLRTLGIEG